MANHFSAVKRARQNRQRNLRNQNARTRLRHAIRQFRQAIAHDPAKARGFASTTISVIDKAVKKGLIRMNTAARYKSRLMTRLAAVK
jgi:small subunit ribosomal protein S20